MNILTLERFNELTALSKAALLEEVTAMQNRKELPAEFDSSGTKPDILEGLKAFIPAEKEEPVVDKVNPIDLFRKLKEDLPKGAILPVRQYMSTYMNKDTGESYTIYMDSGVNEVEQITERPKLSRQLAQPKNATGSSFFAPSTPTPLQDIPDWVGAFLIPEINAKSMKLFNDFEEASSATFESNASKSVGQLLDDATISPTIKLAYSPNQPRIPDAIPNVFFERRPEFARPEHEVAWTVLNSVVDNIEPLPRDSDEESFSTDPRNVGYTELRILKDRINEARVMPSKYTHNQTAIKQFDDRIFFSQLLAYEYKGFSPPRTPDQVNGGVRPSVLKLIRSLADEAGFETIGDSVNPKRITDLENKNGFSFTEGRETPVRVPYKTLPSRVV